MMLKDYIYDKMLQYKISSYVHKQCITMKNISGLGTADIIYVTIAFNNVKVLEYQAKLLKKFSKDKYSYLIGDNSNNREQSMLIEKFAQNNAIGYVKLPINKLKDPSSSHGAALNWICTNVLKKIDDIRYICFLDHDCFPAKEIFLPEALKVQGFYGLKQERDDMWYLWPGFAFFDLNQISVKDLDFTPSYGDTGSGLYRKLFSKLYNDDIKFCTQNYEVISGEVQSPPQAGKIEWFDGVWFHCMNASDWMGINNADKMNKVYKLLDDILIDSR